MRHSLILAYLATIVALSGCSSPPAETPAQIAARYGQNCQAAGFNEGTSDYRLCLLLQRQDERLGVLERRLSRIDRDTFLASPYVYGGSYLYGGPYFGPRRWPYHYW